MTNTSCPFCSINESQIVFASEAFVAVWDAFPVTEGHLLVVSRRHVGLWADLSDVERRELVDQIRAAQRTLDAKYAPDGFNVGFNERAAGGQTVSHFHLHVIPRRTGDVRDPRGGVRNVIPAKGNYLTGPSSRLERLVRTPHERALISGDQDEL